MKRGLRCGKSTLKCAAWVLALGLGAACRPDGSSKVDCEMFKYAGPSFETAARVGKFGAELANKGEMVGRVDAGVKAAVIHWSAVCEGFNAGKRGHGELRTETQKMRGPEAYLWQMDHAADAAAYLVAFQGLHDEVVAPAGSETPAD